MRTNMPTLIRDLRELARNVGHDKRGYAATATEAADRLEQQAATIAAIATILDATDAPPETLPGVLRAAQAQWEAEWKSIGEAEAARDATSNLATAWRTRRLLKPPTGWRN